MLLFQKINVRSLKYISLVETPQKNGLRFQTAKLCVVLQFETEQRHMCAMFGTKTR